LHDDFTGGRSTAPDGLCDSLEESDMEESSKRVPVRRKAAKAPVTSAGTMGAAGTRAAVKPVDKLDGAPRTSPRTKTAANAPADREARIRMAAYLRAERRGFAAGYELDDWIAAELEVSGQENASTPAAPLARSRKAPTRKPPTRKPPAG
jgi:hypothetical protein